MGNQYIKPTHELREVLKKHGFTYGGTYADGDTFTRIRVGGIQGLRTHTEQLVCIGNNGGVTIRHQPRYLFRGERGNLNLVFDGLVRPEDNLLALLDNA